MSSRLNMPETIDHSLYTMDQDAPSSGKVLAGAVFASIVTTGHCNEYVVAFLGQEIQDDVVVSSTINYEVVVTNPGDAAATVQIHGVDGIKTSLDIAKESVGTYEFDQRSSLNGTEIANKSLFIVSESDVLVQVFIHTSDHIEGYLAIPVSHLSTLYQISTFCAIGGFCQLAVAATHANTTNVYLQFPPSVPEIVFCVGKKFFRSKRDRLFSLEKYDVLQIEIASDLTGAYMFSDRPVAVFAGTRNLTMGGVSLHLVEQFSPARRWRKEYILGTLGDNQYGDIIKITAQQAKTTVSIRGFPEFVIENTNHTITRRLDKGTVTYIRANKPIQVVQFSGITYATNGETPRPSMTIVPSIDAFKTKYILSCGKVGDPHSHHHVVVKKAETDDVTVDGGDEEQFTDLTYTPYRVKTIHTPTKDTFIAETTATSPFGGILVCNNTAAMPLTFESPEELNSIEETGPYCIEDRTFYFENDNSSPLPVHRVPIDGYDNIKLRVKTCGHAVIVLYREPGQNSAGRVILTVMAGKILVSNCEPNSYCKNGGKFVDDTYNVGKNCRVGMSFYWIHQDRENDKVCLGYGPYPDTGCTRELASGFTFKEMALSGVKVPVVYNYDLHVGVCDKYLADWRCDDQSELCALYQQDICNDNLYGQWMMANCRKFCQKCQTDIYGRRFLALLRRASNTIECEIHVTGQYGTHNVAVGGAEHVFRGEQVGKTIIFTCTGYSDVDAPILIISDEDVFVTVIFKNVGDHIGTYQVYPVDALGKEMMAFTNDGGHDDCFLATVDYPTTVTVYYGTPKVRNWNNGPADGGIISLQPGGVHKVAGSDKDVFKGVLFTADRRFVMFCGDYNMNFPGFTFFGTEFFQIPPTESLGKEYITTAFEPNPVLRPFDATLLIQADSDNTLVQINGDFEAIIPIYKRGRYETSRSTFYPRFIETNAYHLSRVMRNQQCDFRTGQTQTGEYGKQQIEAGSSYRITANNNINVAMILKDVYYEERKFFLIIPPHSTSMVQQTVYIPLNTGSILSEFSGTKMQSYYVDNAGTSSLSARETVSSDMAASYSSTADSDKYYTVSVVFNLQNKWLVFPGPRHFDRAKEHGLCHTNASVADDGQDNDCDGLKDEDVCFSGYGVYGHDYDLDGGFGEDCVTAATAPSVLPNQTHPLCIPINKPDDQCWTVCSCMCSWVKKLEEKETMTEEEIKQQEDEDKAKYQEALQVDTQNLLSETSQYESAGDDRQSAQTVGYLGICMFAFVFGGLFLLDLTALARDMRIFARNVRGGLERLWDFINGED